MAEAPEVLIQQAQSSLAVGDTAKAQSSLNQLLQQYPHHPQGLIRRGFVRVRAGDVDGAIEDWEQAVELDPSLQRQLDTPEFKAVVESALQFLKYNISQEPSNIKFQIQLGKTYSAFGRYAQALQAFTSALRQAPEEIEAGLGSAQVYVKLGQGEQALQVLQKVYELHPDSVDLCWKLGKLYSGVNSVVQATRFFERASTLDPSHWQSHLELAQIFMRQGRHEQAMARFQRTLQVKSNCAAALVGLAECCKELYRFEDAISYYRQAVALDPRDHKALCQMGTLCIQLGGLDMGIETLLQALDINQNDVEIHSNLAKAYQQKGDLPTAARYFAKTVEFNPKDYFAAYNLGLIYRSQGQIKEAAEAFGTAAQLRPNDSQYQYQSARALLELGKVETALEAARKAVSLNPHSKESQLLFGRCCLEAQSFEAAAEAFRLAVQIDAQNVEAHYQLAVALLQLGQAEEARNSFQTVLRLSPQHAPSQLGLGHVARKTGQWQTAADHYRQAIQLDLTLKPAIQELTKLYLERNQKDSINEFIRQVCLSRKGDHRIPADFLRDWLEALEANQQLELAEEALDFVANIYPTSPQAKENQRLFYIRAARHHIDKGLTEKAGTNIEQLRRISPQDPALSELQQALSKGAPPATLAPPPVAEREKAAYDPSEDPVWEPLSTEPRSPGGLPERKPSGLQPPPIGGLEDDYLFDGGGNVDPIGAGAKIPPPPSISTLLPPPLDDLLDTEVAPSDSWESTQISRLALEDVSAGLNTQESLPDLAQHYLSFAIQLESGGWYKQASLFLTDARNFRPHDPSLIGHQVRILGRWADRLEQDQDHEGARQLRSWLEPLAASQPPILEEPQPVAPPPVVPVEPLPEPEFEPSPAVEASPVSLAPAEKEVPPPVEFAILESAPASEPFRKPEPPLFPPPETEVFASPAPAPLSPPPLSSAPLSPPSLSSAPLVPAEEPVVELTPAVAVPQTEPEPVAAEIPQPAPPAEAVVPESERPVESKPNDIVEWMKSFQEPAPAAAPPTPQTGLAETGPYRSAEFEVSLTGQETVEELTPLLRRYPEDERIRNAIFRIYSDDVPSLLKVFREISLEDPDEPYHVLNLARAYSYTGSDSLAVLQYRKYVKMEPTAEGYQELGEIYERMGKADLASQALKRSQQLKEQEQD